MLSVWRIISPISIRNWAQSFEVSRSLNSASRIGRKWLRTSCRSFMALHASASFSRLMSFNLPYVTIKSSLVRFISLKKLASSSKLIFPSFETSAFSMNSSTPSATPGGKGRPPWNKAESSFASSNLFLSTSSTLKSRWVSRWNSKSSTFSAALFLSSPLFLSPSSPSFSSSLASLADFPVDLSSSDFFGNRSGRDVVCSQRSAMPLVKAT
mmetsp:Transcript_20311/g.49855  ORF Transcript_20311/g.49855 Transcript_20311/m.49855 type:complete len:211 (+) Transcript_20311:3665-4297(+)